MCAEQQPFDRFFRLSPPGVDVEAIRQHWQALGPAYPVASRHLPLPVWARRGFTDTGAQAWKTLCQDLGTSPEAASAAPSGASAAVGPPGPRSARAFCIYVHIPFCASRCAFCDCYSFALRRHRARHVDTYLGLLAQELRLWHPLDNLSLRPVSTVHFGGGTPTLLGAEPFSRLVQNLRQSYNAGPGTEWALESTTSELTPEMLLTLETLGFTRLHVGVQSLQNDVRQAIGRREPATTVLTKIAAAVRAGWIVSVDLIVGLPGQTLSGALQDIRALEAVGVDGFSLYELQLSSQNRRFAERHGLAEQNPLHNYLLFQAASRCLASLGYQRTLFNHFARDRDTNLYFTFPERGEDCLALGTIADGVFGDYHYRHPEYKTYCREMDGALPGLQGGLRRNAIENLLHPLEVALLSGRLPVRLFSDRLGTARANKLFHLWQESAMVKREAGSGVLGLTTNGSWFAGNMMEQLAQLAGASDRR